VRRLLGLLLLSLLGCAPQVGGGQTPASEQTLLLSNGLIQGRTVRLKGLEFSLPGVPLVATTAGERLYVGFPFQLLVYEQGQLENSLPLSSSPRFIKGWPGVVVGLEEGVYTPGRGLLRLREKALDALVVGDQIYWVDGKSFFGGSSLLSEGAYKLVAGDERRVMALTAASAFIYPDGRSISLPEEPLAAVVVEDLYMLGKRGLYRISASGLRIAFQPGDYSAIATDGESLSLLQDGRLVRFNLSLGGL
jgi:hypothetical protein